MGEHSEADPRYAKFVQMRTSVVAAGTPSTSEGSTNGSAGGKKGKAYVRSIDASFDVSSNSLQSWACMKPAVSIGLEGYSS